MSESKDFDGYFESIGLTGVFKDRAHEMINYCRELSGISFTDVFISEYIDNSGMRNFENIWLFNSNVTCEIKNFLTNFNFDCTSLKNLIHWDVKAEKFNFTESNTESRIIVSFAFQHNVTGELKASRENCMTALHIFKKYIQKMVN
jgi:hypothetical protein